MGENALGAACGLGVAFVFASLVCLAGGSVFAGEKVLKICDAYSDESFKLDPHFSFEERNENVVNQIFDHLLTFDPKTNEIKPGLAVSWEKLEGGLRIRLALRKGVAFHNGEAFDAESVRFSLERILDPENKSAQAPIFLALGRVDTVDSHTVDLVMKHPDALICNRIAAFGNIVPPKYIKSVGNEGMNAKPVGTGPFVFKKWTKGKEIVLEANENYWRPGIPGIDRIAFKFFDRTERLEKFLAGELDMIANIKPTAALKVLRHSSDNIIVKKDAFLSAFVTLNTQKGPLRDIRVRKALSHAVNAEMIVRYGARGNGIPRATLGAKGEIGFNPDLLSYKFDPAKAKRLLKEAGYPEGLKLKAGFKMEIGGDDGPFAKVLKAQLLKAGVELETYVMDIVKDVLIPKMNGEIPEPDIIAGLCPSPLGHVFFMQGIFFHSEGFYSMVDDPHYDKLYDRAIRTADKGKHAERAREMERYVRNQAYVINTYQAKRIYAMKRKITFEPALHGMLYLHEVKMMSEQ